MVLIKLAVEIGDEPAVISSSLINFGIPVEEFEIQNIYRPLVPSGLFVLPAPETR